MRGFIEAVVAVDAGAHDAESPPRESFTERALRTRLGNLTIRSAPAYCMESSVSLREIIAQLLVHARDHPPDENVSASQIVSETLQRFHACPV